MTHKKIYGLMIFICITINIISTNMVMAEQSKEKIHKKAYQQFQILGHSENIFPKSKVDNTINPAFKREKFGVMESLRGNTQQFKSNENYGGTNSQFEKPQKSVDEKNIPPQILKMLKKQKKNTLHF